jgi:hypothetical protein
MREIIKNQLLKCTYANLNNYDPATNTFYIPKYSKPQYVVGKMYLIQLPVSLINNITSVTATNWNNGTAPKFQYLKVYVSKLLGKMVYVDSIGYDVNTRQDINSLWSGWLPTEEITQISAL